MLAEQSSDYDSMHFQEILRDTYGIKFSPHTWGVLVHACSHIELVKNFPHTRGGIMMIYNVVQVKFYQEIRPGISPATYSYNTIIGSRNLIKIYHKYLE